MIVSSLFIQSWDSFWRSEKIANDLSFVLSFLLRSFLPLSIPLALSAIPYYVLPKNIVFNWNDEQNRFIIWS
jgi:hypothetical protein